jgi:hypothetical protein
LIRAAGYASRQPWAIAPTINKTKLVATAMAAFVSTDKFKFFPSIMAAGRKVRRKMEKGRLCDF